MEKIHKMINFIEWLKENTSQVRIDDSNLRKSYNSQALQLIDYLKNQEEKANNFSEKLFFHNIEIQLSNYPQIKNLINALNSKNIRYIFDQQQKLRNWILNQQGNSNLRNLSRDISTYIDYLEKTPIDIKGIWESVKNNIVLSNQEMNKVKIMIEEAIGRIVIWNNTQITIVPEASDNFEISSTASVLFGDGEYSPQFTLFQNETGQIEIDDIIEGGDEDFFNTPQIQSDYFNLINELKKPGSTSKGKDLTLYTARPKKDREYFLSQKTLPINVFLANDYDHVEGLAKDFGERDIWKVRINSKYLTKTLDSGRIKEYQITTKAPLIYVELIQ